MSEIRVDLNADLGEGVGFDDQLIPLLSSANIACGFHAGNPHLMRRSVELCVQYGVRIGAHPSFPDMWGFGRRAMQCTSREIVDYMHYQAGALAAFCKAAGVGLQHVKPHGALYNIAGKDLALAEAITESIALFDDSLIVLAQPGSEIAHAAKKRGLRFACEVFADRAYNEDGSLVSRKLKGAVLHDPQTVAQRTVKMVKEDKVTAITGNDISLKADSVCLHGDNPAAIELAKAVRSALEENGVTIAPITEVVGG